MADFISAEHVPLGPVADYREKSLANWASRDLDTLFPAARAHASIGSGRAPPQVADRAANLAAVGKYRRAMEALSSNPVAIGREVHEKLLRLHPQDNDDLPDVLPASFSLPLIKLHAPEVDIMEVVARCPPKLSPHVDGWRFKTLRALVRFPLHSHRFSRSHCEYIGSTVRYLIPRLGYTDPARQA
jgi:hypothetical protein